MQETRKTRWGATAIISGLIAINLPNLPQALSNGRHYRKSILQLADDLKSLNEKIGRGRRVAFYPQGNDFIVNYAAALGNYRAFNIGGDKNVQMAKAGYPASVRLFFETPFDQSFDQRIDRVLSSCDVDAVVIPYFDLQWNAYEWPPDEEAFLNLSAGGASIARVSENRERFEPIITRLSTDPKFEVERSSLFAIISLKTPCDPVAFRSLGIGEEILFQTGSNGTNYLQTGWSYPEKSGTWSQGGKATILLYPQATENRAFTLQTFGYGFVIGKHQTQRVALAINSHPMGSFTIKGGEPVTHRVTISPELLQSGGGSLKIELAFPDAKSPYSLGQGPDERQLAFKLVSLKLE